MKPGRIEKTLQRNLSDLDAHLHFLLEDYAAVIGGDSSYIKRISNTLRTLICLSSGTEGLLWRMVEALGADDFVEIHAVKGLNKEHWLARSVNFHYIPFWRPGDRNYPYELIKTSYKKFVKEGEVVYYGEQTYTHEKLIAFISQQMGSSHEAEGVDPMLVQLSGVSFSSRPTLVEFLLAHAHQTLDVGENILQLARDKTGFNRKNRPEVIIPQTSIEPFSFVESEDFHPRVEETGDRTWILTHRAPHFGWETNGQAYNFGLATLNGMLWSVKKPADSVLEVVIYTPTNVIMKRQAINSIQNLDVKIFLLQKDGKKEIIIGHSLVLPSTPDESSN